MALTPEIVQSKTVTSETVIKLSTLDIHIKALLMMSDYHGHKYIKL